MTVERVTPSDGSVAEVAVWCGRIGAIVVGAAIVALLCRR